MLAERSFSPPIVEINLRKQVLNVKAVHELPFKITVENKLRNFQFKLIHNIIPTTHSLYKTYIKASPGMRALPRSGRNAYSHALRMPRR